MSTTARQISAWRWRRAPAALLIAGALALATTLPALAQSQPGPTVSDRMELVGLVTRQPTPDSPTSEVQFQATINYRLQSAQSGSVMLYLFDNSTDQSTSKTSDAIPVQRGSGQMVLNITYTLRPQVKTLTLVAGLFRAEKQLLAWVSTNAIDMGPWPGRVSFEKAMAARLDNDFAGANQQLTQAIQAAPSTGNFYYWRGDTRVRLDDYAGAVADFDAAITLMPKDRPSRVGRGIARLWLGDSQAAVDDLTFAIDSAKPPDRIAAWAYRARGLARASLGEPTDAVSDLQAYLALSPDAPDRSQVEGWIANLAG